MQFRFIVFCIKGELDISIINQTVLLSYCLTIYSGIQSSSRKLNHDFYFRWRESTRWSGRCGPLVNRKRSAVFSHVPLTDFDQKQINSVKMSEDIRAQNKKKKNAVC